MNVDELIGQLPETLQDLAPVLRLTVGGGSCSQIEGLVQLLDNKVLDPRLLQKLLRHQAAMLLLKCFTTPLQSFRFETERCRPGAASTIAAGHQCRCAAGRSLPADRCGFAARLRGELCVQPQGDSRPESGSSGLGGTTSEAAFAAE